MSCAVQVNETINNILTAFNARIQAKDWLDDVTKQRCEQKVSVEGCVLSCPKLPEDQELEIELY